MTTVTISLPESLKEFVDLQVATKGYGNVSEYFRSLLREAQQKEADALASRLAPGSKHMIVPDPEAAGYAHLPQETAIDWSDIFPALLFIGFGIGLFYAAITGGLTDALGEN